MRACLRKAWLSRRARGGEVAVGDDDLDPLVAQDARGRAPMRSRSGPRRRPRRGRCRPPRSRPCRAACARGGSTAPATRTSSRRRVAAVAGGERLALGVRAPRRAVCQPSPRTVAVADDDGADHRVRRRPAAAQLRQFQRAGEVAAIGVEDGGHGGRWSISPGRPHGWAVFRCTGRRAGGRRPSAARDGRSRAGGS